MEKEKLKFWKKNILDNLCPPSPLVSTLRLSVTKVPITFEEEKLNLYIQQVLIEFLHVSGKGLGTGYEVVCREGGNMNALSVFLSHSL